MSQQNITDLISDFRRTSIPNSITPESVGSLLQAITDQLNELKIKVASLQSVSSESQSASQELIESLQQQSLQAQQTADRALSYSIGSLQVADLNNWPTSLQAAKDFTTEVNNAGSPAHAYRRSYIIKLGTFTVGSLTSFSTKDGEGIYQILQTPFTLADNGANIATANATGIINTYHRYYAIKKAQSGQALGSWTIWEEFAYTPVDTFVAVSDRTNCILKQLVVGPHAFAGFTSHPGTIDVLPHTIYGDYSSNIKWCAADNRFYLIDGGTAYIEWTGSDIYQTVITNAAGQTIVTVKKKTIFKNKANNLQYVVTPEGLSVITPEIFQETFINS